MTRFSTKLWCQAVTAAVLVALSQGVKAHAATGFHLPQPAMHTQPAQHNAGFQMPKAAGPNHVSAPQPNMPLSKPALGSGRQNAPIQAAPIKPAHVNPQVVNAPANSGRPTTHVTNMPVKSGQQPGNVPPKTGHSHTQTTNVPPTNHTSVQTNNVPPKTGHSTTQTNNAPTKTSTQGNIPPAKSNHPTATATNVPPKSGHSTTTQGGNTSPGKDHAGMQANKGLTKGNNAPPKSGASAQANNTSSKNVSPKSVNGKGTTGPSKANSWNPSSNHFAETNADLQKKLNDYATGKLDLNEVQQDIKNGKLDYVDKLFAETLISKKMNGGLSPAQQASLNSVINQLGGNQAILTAAAANIDFPGSDLGLDQSASSGLGNLGLGGQNPVGILSNLFQGAGGTFVEPYPVVSMAAVGVPIEVEPVLSVGYQPAMAAVSAVAANPIQTFANVEPARPAGGMVVVRNPADNGKALTFTIDGQVQQVQPGAEVSVGLPTGNTGIITFDRGNGAQARYTLSNEKGYEFYIRDSAWELREQHIETPAAATPSSTSSNPRPKSQFGSSWLLINNPAENEASLSFTFAGSQRTLEPGQWMKLAMESKDAVLTFDRGDNSEARVPVSAGKIFEFFARDDFWDLRGKPIPAFAANFANE